MTAHALTIDEAESVDDAPPRPLEASVAQLLADALPERIYLVGGHLFEITAAAADGAHLGVSLRQINFLSDHDPRLDVLLQVSIPTAEAELPHVDDEPESSAT